MISQVSPETLKIKYLFKLKRHEFFFFFFSFLFFGGGIQSVFVVCLFFLKGWGDSGEWVGVQCLVTAVFMSPLKYFIIHPQRGGRVCSFRAQGEKETFTWVSGVLGKAVGRFKKNKYKNQLLLIWAEVRWCSAAWDGRSERSCWRGGSCSPPPSWEPDRPGRWGAGGASGRGALPWGPAAGRTYPLRRRRKLMKWRLRGQNGRKRSQRRLVICSGCRKTQTKIKHCREWGSDH